MGTPEFAVPALKALQESSHHIVAVYSQPPRPSGRGHKIHRSPVHLYAQANKIPVFTPQALKTPEDQKTFSDHKCDAAIVAAYGLILPQAILQAPQLGCFNIHASLLPRWRGAAPIQRAILAGDQKTGITIMQMDKGLDTGAILQQKPVSIEPDTTAAQLHDALAHLGAEMMVETVNTLAQGQINPTPQPEQGVTYAEKLSRDEGKIDWHQSALELERKVRALNPWPGVWFEWNQMRIKVLKAAVVERTESKPGVVIDKDLTIACGEQALQLIEIQVAGSKPMSASEFLNGHRVAVGTQFS